MTYMNIVRDLYIKLHRELQYFWETGKRQYSDLDIDEQRGLAGKVAKFVPTSVRCDIFNTNLIDQISHAAAEYTESYDHLPEHGEWAHHHKLSGEELLELIAESTVKMAESYIEELFKMYAEENFYEHLDSLTNTQRRQHHPEIVHGTDFKR